MEKFVLLKILYPFILLFLAIISLFIKSIIHYRLLKLKESGKSPSLGDYNTDMFNNQNKFLISLVPIFIISRSERKIEKRLINRINIFVIAFYLLLMLSITTLHIK